MLVWWESTSPFGSGANFIRGDPPGKRSSNPWVLGCRVVWLGKIIPAPFGCANLVGLFAAVSDHKLLQFLQQGVGSMGLLDG